MPIAIGALILLFAHPAAAASNGMFSAAGGFMKSIADALAAELGEPICACSFILAALSAALGLGAPSKLAGVFCLSLVVVFGPGIVGKLWEYAPF